MDLPENTLKPSYLMKITILGNTLVGKTQIVNQWVKNKTEETKSTIGSDFITKYILYKNQKIQLQIWDTAGAEKYVSMITAFMHRSELVLIVVDAHDEKDEKIKQINKWLQVKNKYCPAAQVIIIENKIDLPKVTILKDADLTDFSGSYYQKISLSAFLKESFTELNSIIHTISPQIFEGLASLPDVNNPEPTTTRAAYEVTKTNIRTLNDTLMNMLCTSLRNLLIRGPINQPNKSYDMKFGGGKTYVDEKIPEHVHAWITSLDFPEGTTAEAKRSQLIAVYEHSINVSQHKPFFRSLSTHCYYKDQLPGYIEHCVKKSADGSFPYFNIRENLKKLANFPDMFSLNAIRDKIIDHLQLGALNNQVVPYNVRFFGSKKYKLPNAEFSISVPAHVSAILNYLNNDQTDILSKLIFVLDYSIASKFSTCSSRDRTTQEFYNTLPAFIAAEIAGTLESLQGENALRPLIL